MLMWKLKYKCCPTCSGWTVQRISEDVWTSIFDRFQLYLSTVAVISIILSNTKFYKLIIPSLSSSSIIRSKKSSPQEKLYTRILQLLKAKSNFEKIYAVKRNAHTCPMLSGCIWNWLSDFVHKNCRFNHSSN